MDHKIKLVARKTGLSPHLIRIWERRYGAVKPKRTPAGHRLYSDEDIERLILLRRATLAGESIGRIANLPLKTLVELVSDISLIEADSVRLRDRKDTGPEYYLGLCIEAVNNLDASTLESRLLSASIALGQRVFLDEVLQPLLVKTGDLWNDGSLRVAHEHLASAVIRSLLGNMIVSSATDLNAPLLLSTTPVGQLHEFGALMASVAAISIGWQSIYLGPNLPAEDIATAARQRKADLLALSIIYPPDDPRIHLELKKLSNLLDENCRIIVGGQAADGYTAILSEIDAIKVKNLADFKSRLVEIRKNRLKKDIN
jgi:methanogenic corrinoid protein MtbC1